MSMWMILRIRPSSIAGSLPRIDGPLEDTVAAKRAITVRDVLTFRMGFGIVWGPPNALPIQRAANDLHLSAFGPPRVQEPPAPAA